MTPDLRKIEPLALTTDGKAALAVREKVMEVPEGRLSKFPVFLHLAAGSDVFPGKVEALGGRARKIHPRLYAGEIPGDAERYISHWPEVAYIEAAKRVRPLLDVSRPAVRADVVHAGTGLPAPYSGAGVYVGIVDTGISGSHPDFTGRIASGFSFSPRSDPLRDTDGHGTHVAGIAAGDGASSSGEFTGMAPGSSLLAGKAGTNSFFTTDVIQVMDDILSFAGTTPVAINLSLGLVTGPHDGTSGFESAIASLATSGVSAGGRQVVVAAAGNERTAREHFQTTIPPFGLVNIPLSLETGGTLVDIWADGADRYTVTATLGSDSASAPSGTSATSTGGTVSVSNRTDAPPNGATHVTMFLTASTPSSPATIRLERTRNGGGGKVDAYVDFLDGTFPTATEAGTISEPANAMNVIAVGSFNTKSFRTGNPVPQNISSFSSLGPSRDGRIKPEVAAPGNVIYSTRAKEAPDGNYWEIVSGFDNNYAVLAGTSMASPHVAGIAALAWESNPALTSSQMRERLKRTATPVPPVPNTTWGYGKADALAAVSASVASITAPATAVPGFPMTLTSENSSGAFGNEITAYQWSAAPGATVTPPNGPATEFQANAPGNYSVSLTVTAGGTTSPADSRIIRVNRVPLAGINGPSADNVGIPVTFSGTASSDPDGQPLQFRWVLVSRPAGSSALLSAAGSGNVTLTPDFAGTYEIGLRADDGLDNSALATKTFTTLGGTATSPGGGGGCSVGSGNGGGDECSALASVILLLLPLWLIPARRKHPSPGSGSNRPPSSQR